MPYYFLVTFANTIILMLIQKSSRLDKLKEIYMMLFLVGFMWVSYGKYLFGMNDLYFWFYGYVTISYLQGLPIYDIQSAKFLPFLKS